MSFFSPMLWLIGLRSLLQHRVRSMLLGGAIALVAALFVLLTGVSEGMRSTLLTSATTLMSGHVNVGGFFKATATGGAPVVTGYQTLMDELKAEVPELDYVVQRGRGWAKLVSDTRSRQVGIGGIDITREPGFRKVVQLRSGSLDDLTREDSVLLFEEQAEKLEVKVGDRLTFSAPTYRGTSNTIDVTVVAIAANIGMLSSWNTFMNDRGLRKLYQLNDETTGVLQLYLKDIADAPRVQEKLRRTLAAKGYQLMDPDPRPFFAKFDTVNRESWTGQKLDITTWEDETSFVQWFVLLLNFTFSLVIFILVGIIGVGIMNVMWITIRERTREIGTLRAVGMQKGAVLSMFVTEGFLLGLFGTSTGALIGVAASWALTGAGIVLPKGAQLVLMSEQLTVLPTATWVSFAILFITSAITFISIFPSFLAARLKPITAMSHVG